MTIRKILFYILLCCVSQAEAQNNIDKVLKSVVENNIELKAIRSDNAASLLEQKSENAVAGPDIEYSPFYHKGYSGVQSSELIVSEEFDFPTKYAQRKRQAKLDERVMDSEYEARKREITIECRKICYDIIELNQRIDLLVMRHEKCDSIVKLLQRRLAAGDANALEVNMSMMERMQTAQDIAEARNERANSLLQLQRLNGGIAITIDDSQLPDVCEMIPTTYPTLLPEVQSAEHQLAASRHNESLAKSEWLPNVKMGYRRNTEEGVAVNGFLVGVSFPLISTSGKVRAARQRRESAEMRLRDVSMAAENDQRVRYQKLVELRNVLDHSDVKLMQETLPLLDKALSHGQINAFYYYTECNSLYDKLMKHVALHSSFLKLYAELFGE